MKNYDVFLRETGKNSKEVRTLIEKDEDAVSKLLDVCAAILWISDIARNEGLLALEEAAKNERVNGVVLGEEMKLMTDLVVDGTDQELVEEICFKRYFSNNYSGLEGLVFLAYMDSMLNIQAGVNPGLMKKGVKALMPGKVNTELEKHLKQQENDHMETDEDKWKARFKNSIPDGDSSDYLVLQLLNFCFESMSDKDIQRTLREIDTDELALCLKALGGEACRRLHDNLSMRYRSMLIREMESTGPVRIQDIADTDARIIRLILKLGVLREISVPGKLDHILV